MAPCLSSVVCLPVSVTDVFKFSDRNYVNESTAMSKGLVAYTSNSFTLRADHTTQLPGNGPGRDSVRVRSKKTYTTHVAMYVPPRSKWIAHMHNFSSALTSVTCPPVAGRLLDCRFRLYAAYAFLARTWPAVWENGDPWPSKVRTILLCGISHFLNVYGC